MTLHTKATQRQAAFLSRGLSMPYFWQHTPAPTRIDSDDEEYLPTADLDDAVWSEKPVPNNQEYMCIHQIPRPATQPPQSNQMEMPQESEPMDIDIQEDLPDLISAPEELLSDFDSWAHSVLDYQWQLISSQPLKMNGNMTFKFGHWKH